MFEYLNDLIMKSKFQIIKHNLIIYSITFLFFSRSISS